MVGRREGTGESPQKVKWRAQYDGSEIEAGELSGIVCPEETLTQQQFREEADINTLVQRFGLDKIALPVAPFDPAHYGDFSDVPDLRTALDLVNDAKNRFMDLPPALRHRFHNSPGELWDFVNDPENGPEAVRLGLLAKAPEPFQDETKPPPEGGAS
jgi:hypothetical protein